MRMLLLAAAAAAISTAALAAPPPPGPGGGPPPGGRLFIAPDGEPFRQADGRAAWFAGADADHDGRLTVDEFTADALRFFRVVDADGDGTIGSAENRVYEEEIAPEITRMSFDRAGPGDGRGPGPGGGERRKRPRGEKTGGVGREGAARFSLLNEPQPVRGADANLDYRVTAAEWAKAAARRHALLDRDGDGVLTLATLPSAPGPGPEGSAPIGRGLPKAN